METGFPKVRNPNLTGIACKHIVRVAAEIDKSSGSIVMFLERLMAKAKSSDTGKASIRTSQKEAERTIKNQARRTTGNKIITSADKQLRNASKPKKTTRNSSVANASDAVLINELISRGILPERNSMARNIVLNHPNSYNAIIRRKQVNRTNSATLGGMAVIDSEDESRGLYRRDNDG